MSGSSTGGWYSSIGNSITLRLDLKDLPRRDKVALMHRLMEETGFTSLLYKPGRAQGFMDVVTRCHQEATEKYLKEG